MVIRVDYQDGTEELEMIRKQDTVDENLPMISPFDLGSLFADFMRFLASILLISAIVAVAVIVPNLQAPKRYTATSSIIIDPRPYNELTNDSVVSGLPTDTAQVDTEVEVLKSSSIAEAVINSLRLYDDPEFAGQYAGTAAQNANSQLLKEQVVNRVLAGLLVKRVGLTRVIDINYNSLSAEKSARIANEWARLYIEQQLDSKLVATNNAKLLVSQNESKLRDQAFAAKETLENFKLSNQLRSPDGIRMIEQDISLYSQQVAQLSSEAAEAKSRWEVAKATSGRSMANGSDALDSSVIQNLKTRRAEAASDLASLATRYGPKHPKYMEASQRVIVIDKNINAETNRIVNDLYGQYVVKRDKLASMQSALANAQSTLAHNNQYASQLNNLQTQANSAQTLYETYLDKSKEIAAREGGIKADARIVSNAAVPSRPSSPIKSLVILLGIMCGIFAGLVYFIIRKLFDVGINSATDVEQKLGIQYLGSIYDLRSTLKLMSKFKGTPRDYIIQNPLSTFAEGFRSLRATILYSKAGESVKTVAITSAFPKEGKTTTSICMATVAALSGQSVLVVDCDIRRQSLSSTVASRPQAGLLEYLNNDATLDEIIQHDKTGVDYILMSEGSATARDIFGSEGMKKAIEVLKGRYDLVIFDTAPLLPVSDSRPLTKLADATILLSRWRKTPKRATSAAANIIEDSNANLAGLVLTQVNYRQSSYYGHKEGSYYKSDEYLRYLKN